MQKLVKIDDIPKAEEVLMDSPVSVLKVCQDMEKICKEEDGIGLSAVQIGVPWKLFIIRNDGRFPDIYGTQRYSYFVNCDYEATDVQQIVSLEGCLSVRSEDGRLRLFQVKRHKNIRLYGYLLNINKSVNFEAVDCKVSFEQQCVVIQHEIDHQKGVLISDHGKEIFVW